MHFDGINFDNYTSPYQEVSTNNIMQISYSLFKLSWRDRERGRKLIHLTENGSNKRHVILMGVNARRHYQMPV